jgi:large subunit ribosomal protein L22
MLKYAFNSKPEKSAKAYGRGLRISTKNALVVCSAINGKPLEKGKSMLEDLISQRNSLGGKYYTKTSEGVMEILKSAESNAEFKGLDAGRVFIHASAHKGFGFWRPRAFKMRGQRRKVTNVQIVLEQR